jgi:hypothetical protein
MKQQTYRLIAFCCTYLGWLWVCPLVSAADADWKVGVAQVKITPERPVLMAGYANRTKPFEKVAADLYVKVLVLEDRAGQRAALVTSDLIGFPAAVAEPICTRISTKTGLKRSDILLTAAHNHAGPQLSLKARNVEGGGAGEAERSVEYTRQLEDKVVEAVVQAAAHCEPARLSYGSGVVDFPMNRREFTPRGVILGVNPRGLADRSVPVLRTDSTDGKPRAILFGAGVHNTTLTGQGPLQIAFDEVDLPLQTLSREELQKLATNKRDAKSWGAVRMLAMLDRGEKPPTHYRCPATVWQLGHDLTLVGLSGEVVADYLTFLEQALGPNQLWVVAYCNDVFGYLPSARVLREGGYETRGLYSGGAGFFDPKAQDVLVQKVRELARKAGRKLPD